MVSTPISQSQKLSPLQQQLIDGLNQFPNHWALTPVYGDKRPYRKNWQSEPPISKDLIERDIRNLKAKGYGLRTGIVSGGIVAVDADGHAAHDKILELSGGVLLPETVAFTSNKPGRCQYLFYIPQEYWEAIATKKISTGVKGGDGKETLLELRWDGCQSVLPPSVHPETGFYCWRKSPQEIEIAPCPMWIIEQMLAKPDHAIEPTSYTESSSNQRLTDEEWALSYLSALGSTRADDYDNWLAVGMALHSVSDSLLTEWDNWSRQSSKYKSGDCEKKWKSFKRQGVAIGTLAHMAKQDGWRSPFNKSTGRSFSGGIGSGGGSRRPGGSGGSGGDGGDGGDGDEGNRNSKVVKHPSFNPISSEELETRLNELVQEGLTGSRLTNKLNQLSLETGRHVIELRKQYLELVVEIEQEELRGNTAQEVEALLEASTASVDLHEILPSTLATPLLKLAGWLNLKPETYLTALLTTVSTLHKASTTVVLNKEWDFEVSPNLFSLLIGSSSQKKSPILKAICQKPLRVLQKWADEHYKHQRQIYEEELKKWEEDKSEDKGPAPTKPERKIYFFTKATGEGITYQTARCPEQGMLYLSDELAGMLGAQNQYRGGKGSDKQDLLSYYDGTGDVVLRADGVKSESDFTLLGIIGGIQPKILQKILEDCSDPDGGWARFMFVNQPNAASQMSADGGSYDLTNLLAGLYEQIDALPPTTYRLSPEAFRLFCKAYNELEKKRVSDRLEGMQAVWGKSEGRIGKLAVNLHVIHALMNGETPSEEIPVEIIQIAITLTKYYAQQVQSLYTQFSDPDALAPHFVRVIQLAQRKGDWIKASDVYLSITKNQRPSGEKVREWFSELVLMGKGEVKGEGRNLQFRIFSDKNPSPPSSDPPPLSNQPSEKLDEIRQELDKSSNTESTTYQGSQELLDKLDDLDNSQKVKVPPVVVDEQELDDIQDEVKGTSGENPVFAELSNLSNKFQDDLTVDDTALDDLSKESSNLDNSQEMVDLAYAPAIAEESGSESDSEEVAQPIESTFEEEVAVLAPILADEGICPNKEELAIFRRNYSVEVLKAACKHLTQERYCQIMAWVLQLNAEAQPQPVENSVEAEAEQIVVGSVVLWDNCPGHWDYWSPFVVECIDENGMVKLEMAQPDCLVHISELRLANQT